MNAMKKIIHKSSNSQLTSEAFLKVNVIKKSIFGDGLSLKRYSVIGINQQICTEENELRQQIKSDNKKIIEVLEGKYYSENLSKILSNSSKPSVSACEKGDKEYKLFDPYKALESINVLDIEYSKLNVYTYFTNYSLYLNSISHSQKLVENQMVESITKTFIECLCKMYLGHNLHYKIEEEISKSTNLNILKGDFLFSQSYYILSKKGNPMLIKYYSKISEIFAKSIFSNQEKGRPKLFSKFGTKLISFIYLGCLGIKELMQFDHNDLMLIMTISLKYGMLVYLKEELSFFGQENKQYLSKIEDVYNSFLVVASKTIKSIVEIKVQDTPINSLLSVIENKKQIEKYNYLSAHLCAEIFELIDRIDSRQLAKQNKTNQVASQSFKEFLLTIHKDIESYSKI